MLGYMRVALNKFRISEACVKLRSGFQEITGLQHAHEHHLQRAHTHGQQRQQQRSCKKEGEGEWGWVGGGARGGSSFENLHAMVAGVSHDDAPVAVDGHAATRLVELSVA